MPASYVRGPTIELLFGASPDPLAALEEAEISRTLESLPAAHPTAAGSRYAVPGLRGWEASASGLVLLGETEAERGAAMQALLDAQRQRQYVACRVVWPDGVEENGQAIVSGITRQWGPRRLLKGSYRLRGVGTLE